MYTAISIYNRKGGVGKTMSSINIAAILASRGYKVLGIDLDPQANFSKFFGYVRGYRNSSQLKLTVDDILNDEDNELNIMEAIYPTDFKNLYVLPASKKLERTERSLLAITSIDTRTILLEHMMSIIDNFDYVIVDLAPNAEGIVNCNGLCATDKVFVPMYISEFEMDALDDAIKITKNLRSANAKLHIAGTFMCKFEKNVNNSKEAVENIRLTYPDLYMSTNIRKANAIINMSFDEIPLIYKDPKMKLKITQDYVALVDEMLRRP